MRTKIVLLLAAISFFVTAAAEAIVLIPRALRTPSAYIEVVHEKDSCERGGCFVEYIVMSDGQAMKKQYDSPKYENATPTILTRTIPLETAELLMAQAGKFFKSARPQSKRQKNRDTVYYFDGEGLFSSTMASDDERPPAYITLFQSIETAFEKSEPAEDFYLHDYYRPKTGDIEDFHVFPSGTIIFSLFDRQAIQLNNTRIFAVDEATIETLKKMAEKTLPQAPAPYKKCAAASGIDYAGIEFSAEGRLFKSYSCADDDSPLTALFRYIRALRPNDIP